MKWEIFGYFSLVLTMLYTYSVVNMHRLLNITFFLIPEFKVKSKMHVVCCILSCIEVIEYCICVYFIWLFKNTADSTVVTIKNCQLLQQDLSSTPIELLQVSYKMIFKMVIVHFVFFIFTLAIHITKCLCSPMSE